MLVKYKLVSGGTYTQLFNESSGDANEDFAPAFRDQVPKFGGYGAPSETRVPLSNTAGNTTFKWSSNYSTADAAAAAIATLRSTFKGVPVHLQITVGVTVLYLPNAVLNASTHKQKGIECWHQLTFDHDDIQTTAP